MRRLELMGAVLLLILILGLSAAAALSNPPPQEPPPPALIEQLQQQTEGKVRISYHAQTGKVRFIGTDPAHPIPRPAMLAAEATPEQAARQFLATYGRLFGLTNQADELRVMRTKSADRGRSFVRFQQVYQGVPVMGGELIVQLDASKNVLSANGEVLPDLAVDLVPTIDAEAARQTALAKVAKDYGLSVADLSTTEPELWIYNPILLGGPGLRFNSLVWRMDVEPREPLPIRELVLIDAHLGAVALHFNQIDTAKNRQTYDANNGTTLPGTLVCDESNPTCSGGDAHEVAAHVYAGDTYDFYSIEHGRDSINNAGMTIISTVHYGVNYANAFWNGSQMVYGDYYGFPLADDVVGHELTHGVTQYESGLFYYYQSGAINESFSDIWGEFVDQEYATGNDAGDTRWDIGEDVSGLGALRNMQDPTLHGDPDKMSSTNYYCAQAEPSVPYGDNGGVHTNSGVSNKAAYLMTDGGTFNFITVTGLGYEKVADLYYEVQTNLFTSASDYADLYDGLIQACNNLGYIAADCQAVQNAVDATEMNLQPTGCPANEAPVCDGGVTAWNLFFDDMESGAGNWTHAATIGTDYWYLPQNPNALSFDATYATSGVYNIWGFDQGSPYGGTSDTYIAMNSNVALPSGTTAYLHFNHAFGFESSYPAGTFRYDGGIVEYSTDGGSNWYDAGSLFTHNGYNGTLQSSNPLTAIPAFSADSRGYISSRLDLTSLAGQSVRFRFRMGTDSGGWDWGWFIDDVRIYTCEAVSPTPTPSAYVYLPLVMKNYSSSGGWVTIVSEDFEGSFPGSWTVGDNEPGYGEYYWGKRDCRPYAGSFSGWGVGGGANGAALACSSNYPDHTQGWMIYGPFSLADATAADLQFKQWVYTESTYDKVCRMASTNGTNFLGWCTSGNTGGWADTILDLAGDPNLGDLTGQPNVWVALIFDSDYSVNKPEGGYVDNILLRKCTLPSCPTVSIQAPPEKGQIVEIPMEMTLPR